MPPLMRSPSIIASMIYVTHGVVSSYRSERISHSLCLPTSRAARHLQLRRKKYVPLAQAIAGHGDALTVDDATYAGLELALLARRFGHAVSWFVNGSHVENKIQYFPFQISSMLDTTRAAECRFEGQTWNLVSIAGRRALRGHIKHLYMSMRSQSEIEALIDRLAVAVDTTCKDAEKALRTVGPEQLAQAVLAGVDLQNHGWGHLNPEVLSEEECRAELRQNEDYLSQFRRAITPVFAPPFGQRAVLDPAANFVLLANRNLSPDHKDGQVVNRGDLVLATASQSARIRVSFIEKRRAAA